MRHGERLSERNQSPGLVAPFNQRAAATLIDRPAPRRREHPPAPSHLIAAEASQTPNYRDPRLGRDILVHLAQDDAQIPHQGRVDIKPQARKCRLVAALGTRKDAGELCADHTSQCRSGSARPASDQQGDRPFGGIVGRSAEAGCHEMARKSRDGLGPSVSDRASRPRPGRHRAEAQLEGCGRSQVILGLTPR